MIPNWVKVECIFECDERGEVILPAREMFYVGNPIDDEGEDLPLVGAMVDGQRVHPNDVIAVYHNGHEQPLDSVYEVGVMLDEDGEDCNLVHFRM